MILSETYLDLNTPSDDNNLEISGYSLFHLGNSSNNKRVVALIYYKSYLPLRIRNICNKVFLLKLNWWQTRNFASFYRSPSQSQDDFEILTQNRETETLTLNQATGFG